MANAEQATPSGRFLLVEYDNTDGDNPTKTLNGVLFVSGGALHYIGSSDTMTLIAAA